MKIVVINLIKLNFTENTHICIGDFSLQCDRGDNFRAEIAVALVLLLR